MNEGYLLVVCIKECTVLESNISTVGQYIPTFLVTKVYFLSNGVHWMRVSCVLAGQWAWETGLYVDGGAAVRKLRKRHAVKLANTTGK